jgi:starch synthase
VGYYNDSYDMALVFMSKDWKGDLRVLMVTPDYPPSMVGGCALSCQLVVEGLRSRGIHTDVLAFNGDRRPPIESDRGSVRFFEHRATLLGLNYSALMEMGHLQDRYDIVHVYNCQQIPAAVIYGGRVGAKVVATLNNMVPVCTNPSDHDAVECGACDPLESLRCAMRKQTGPAIKAFMPVHWAEWEGLRYFTRQVDAFIALSQETKDAYVLSGYDGGRIQIIPNMYDPSIKGLVGSIPDRPDTDDKVVVYIGRLEVEKGVQTLIAAIARLERGDIKLYLVGKGDHEESLKGQVKDLGIGDKVEFVGFLSHDEVARYYRLADAFVHPALWPEPFPRTLLEALAFDVPLIVSDRGASANVLGEAGVVFPAGDPVALADRLVEVLDDPERSLRMAQLGREVLARYSPERVMGEIVELYRRTLAVKDII